MRAHGDFDPAVTKRSLVHRSGKKATGYLSQEPNLSTTLVIGLLAGLGGTKRELFWTQTVWWIALGSQAPTILLLALAAFNFVVDWVLWRELVDVDGILRDMDDRGVRMVSAYSPLAREKRMRKAS